MHPPGRLLAEPAGWVAEVDVVVVGSGIAGLTTALHVARESALRVLHLVHELAPALPVIVRSHDDTEIDKLRDAGAAEVVPEAIEGSLMLASHALLMLGVPLRRVLHRVQDARGERYAQSINVGVRIPLGRASASDARLAKGYDGFTEGYVARRFLRDCG